MSSISRAKGSAKSRNKGSFVAIEALGGPAAAQATHPSLPGSAIKDALNSLVREAQDLAVRGAAGRLVPDFFLSALTGPFTIEELHHIVIPARTLARRKAKGEALSFDETERALRLARIANEAERVFADAGKAARWLRKPNRAFNQNSPLALLETETGARTVEELLAQIDHGIFI